MRAIAVNVYILMMILAILLRSGRVGTLTMNEKLYILDYIALLARDPERVILPSTYNCITNPIPV